MLNSKQRAKLRAMAHELQPIIYVGKAGITDNVIKEVVDALPKNELIKGSVQQNCPLSAKEAMNEILEKSGAETVSTAGRKFVIYKKNEEDPVIKI